MNGPRSVGREIRELRRTDGSGSDSCGSGEVYSGSASSSDSASGIGNSYLSCCGKSSVESGITWSSSYLAS